mgnify:CR=1 FL=1
MLTRLRKSNILSKNIGDLMVFFIPQSGCTSFLPFKALQQGCLCVYSNLVLCSEALGWASRIVG